MKEPAHGTVFDTPIGRCGIAWRGEMICAVSFPTKDDRSCLASMRRFCGQLVETRPSGSVGASITQIQGLLSGHDIDLSEIPVELGAATDFERRVYNETLKIRRGRTRTYGEIAGALGDPQASRAVGRALGRNPVPIIVPCHRVLAAGGRTGGFSGAGGVSTKLRLLMIEGATIGDQPNLFDHIRLAG